LAQLWKFKGAADAMTSLSFRLALGIGLAAAAGAANCHQARDPLAPLPPSSAAPKSQSLALPPRIAPASLRERVTALGRAFNGSAGISVVSLSEGWQADYNATSLFPQQSCSKLWVAITAMDAVDRGRISLNDKVTLGRNDLTLFHQPISAKISATEAIRPRSEPCSSRRSPKATIPPTTS
jgi:beta-lactamase class A